MHPALAGLALAAALIAPAAAAHAAPRGPGGAPLPALARAELARAAAQLGLRDVEIEVGAPDPRLRLAACPAASAHLPPGSTLPGRVAVELSCPGQWTVRVPARVRAYAPVLVTRRAVARGTELTARDVRAVRRELGPAGRQIESVAVLAGHAARRPLAAGTVLGMHDLQAVLRVRRGEQVTVARAGPGFAVTTQAVALRDGADGQRIAVRAASGRTLEGVVTGPGAVEVR